MRIGIDCRLAGARHAGIGRYTENLVRQVTQHSADRWVLFFFDRSQADQVLPGWASLPQVTVVFVPIRHYTLREQILLPWFFWRHRLDLLHVPHFNVPLLYRGTYVVTIHDLLWHEQRGSRVTTLSPWVYWLKYWAYRIVATNAVQQAQAIFVPAEIVKATLIAHYPTAIDKVVVTKEGVAEAFIQPISANAKKKNLHTLVYVGSFYPHKNIEVILQALLQLPEYRLQLIGARSVFQDQIKNRVIELGLTDRVEFGQYVTDESLAERYQSVTALIQPSFSEGFGLTGLEAMAAGLPVIASNIPVFKEIYQNGAVLFDPHQPDELVNAIGIVEKNRSALIQKAKKISQSYSWATMADQTMAVYARFR